MATNLKVGASTSQFNSQVRQMTQELKALQSSFGVASTQAKLFGNSTEQLKTKQNELTAKMQIQNNMSKAQEGLVNKLTGDLDKQKNKRAELASKIEETNKKYKESVQATGKNSEESKKLKQELTGLKEEYAKNDKAIESTNKQLQNAEIKLNKTKKSILENKKALEEVNKKLKDVKLDKFQKSMEKTSKTTGKIASAMKPAAIATAGFGAAAVKTSMDFEDGMHKVYTIADKSVVPVKNMQKAIIDLSNQTGISVTDIENNVYDAISAGQKTGDAVNFVANSTKLAKAGFAEAGQSLDLLTTIMNAYGLKASEVNSVSDKLITTQNLGKVTVGQLSESMGKVIPTAKAFGVNLSQITAGYALMTSKGIKSAETTTYMSGMLNELGKSGTNASKTLKSATGKTFQQLTKSGMSLGDILNKMNGYAKKNGKSLADMFGNAEAGKAALVLSGNAGKDFNSMLKEMDHSAGATDKAFKEVSSTTQYNLKGALNQSKNALIGFGDVIAPFVSLASQGISKVAKAFNGLSQTQKKIFVGIGAGILSFTGLFFGISKVTGAISTAIINYKKIRDVIKAWQVATKLQTSAQTALNIVMNMNPIGLVVIAVAALVAGLVVLYKHCKPFQQFIDGIGKSITNFVKSIPAKLHLLKVKLIRDVTALKVKGHQFLEKVKTKLKQFGRNVKYGITHFPEIIGRTIGVIAAYIYTGIMNVKNFVFHTVPETMKAVFNWFWELPGKIWTALCQAVTKVTQWGVNTYHAATTAASNTIKAVFNWFKQLPGKIWNGLVDAYHKVIEWGSNLWSAGKNAGSQLVHSVVDTVKSLPGKMLDIGKNIVTGIWNGICGAAGWLKNQVSSFCSGVVDGFKSALGIHSPSRVLRDEVGKFMAQGVGVGFTDEMQQVNSNIEQTLNRTINTRIVPSLNTDQLQSINARVNDNTNNDITVIVQNVTSIDGETISTKIYKKVAKKINDSKNDYKVTKGMKGRVGYA